LALAAALATQLTLVLLVGIASAVNLTASSRTRRRAFAFGAWLFSLAALVLLPMSLVYHAAGAPVARASRCGSAPRI
ncbi:MAG: hypothetical protein AAB265_17355, partial [candidate division NC10 bacterium]